MTGIGPGVAPKFFAIIIGLPEFDPIYQMAGGATLGYAIAALLASLNFAVAFGYYLFVHKWGTKEQAGMD